MNQRVFDKEALHRSILMTSAPGVTWVKHLHIFDSLDSTNNKAKEMAEAGCPHGTIIIADTQSHGRGRMGRSFHSPSGLGLYMSVVLRPNCRPAELMHLTCATGVAVLDGIYREVLPPEYRHIGRGPAIKWTNDIVFPPYKLGGILTELSIDSGTGLVRYAILGIGLNLYHNTNDFPPELRDTAGSLGMYFPCNLARNHLINSILYELHRMDAKLLTGKKEIMDRYRKYCYTIGQEVSVHRFDQVRHGTAIGVDDDGALLVQFPDGHTEAIGSGEVSIRGMYGYV